ncbi:hypothetical protein ILYODFUR_033642 [Ilyodon furcidens]|uniref:Uncharacterized protein n=1 Tax=Ilyodon furcidens TaxID=33524 RepID=A0ABV0SUV8_9TELE
MLKWTLELARQVQPGTAAPSTSVPPLCLQAQLSPQPAVSDTPSPDGSSSKHHSYPDDLGVDKHKKCALKIILFDISLEKTQFFLCVVPKQTLARIFSEHGCSILFPLQTV